MTQPLVTIYAPSGAMERHTTLNATDLVRDCGYTFKQGKLHHPTDGVPYADPTTAKLPSRAQQAIDSVGTGSEIGAEAHLNALSTPSGATPTSEPRAAAPVAPPAAEPAAVETPAPVEAVEPEVVVAPVETAPEAAAPAAQSKPAVRQQRAKKGS